MQFRHLKPGDFFRFRAQLGRDWRDQAMYRKAGERTYHRANKILPIYTVEAPTLPVIPEGSDAMPVEAPKAPDGAPEALCHRRAAPVPEAFS